MNWVGRIVQKQISRKDTILDIGCGKGTPTNGLKCEWLIGLDAWKPWLTQFQGEKILGDIRHLPFRHKAVEVVTALDVIEHLNETEARVLLIEMERIATRTIIVYTPLNFKEQNARGNPFNKHKTLITPSSLKRKGYKVTFPKPDRNIFAAKKFLRILHVWCQAGVSSILAKYQTRLGHHAFVVKWPKFDGLKIGEFYGEFQLLRSKPTKSDTNTPTQTVQKTSLSNDRWSFVPTSVRKMYRLFRGWLKYFLTVKRFAPQFDVLHIHYAYLVCCFFPLKPKVLEYHGSAGRKYFNVRFRYKFVPRLLKLFNDVTFWVFKHFTPTYVSTKDLLQDMPHSEWLPNPVDTEHFTPTNLKKTSSEALYIHNWYENGLHAKELAEKHGWKLIVLDRANKEYVKHEDMPTFLGQFNVFIDRHAIHSFSKTGLEALALGLKVVRWDGEMVEALPKQHTPENVADLSIKLYREVLK